MTTEQKIKEAERLALEGPNAECRYFYKIVVRNYYFRDYTDWLRNYNWKTLPKKMDLAKARRQINRYIDTWERALRSGKVTRGEFQRQMYSWGFDRRKHYTPISVKRFLKWKQSTISN